MSEFTALEAGSDTLSNGGVEVSAGLEKAYSFADISPAEADVINDKVNIVVCGTSHTMSDPANTDPAYLAAVDAQYQGLADMVEALDPVRGDVLYMEAPLHENLWILLDRSWDDDMHAAVLEGMRANRTIHPYTYATERAALRGVPVKVADIHRHVAGEFEFVTGESVDNFKSDIDHPLFPIFNTLREEQAANSIAHDALDAIPRLGSDRPTYMLLQGCAHVDSDPGAGISQRTPGTQAAFGRLGLKTTTRLIYSHDYPAPETRQTRVDGVATYIAPIVLH